MRSTYIPSMAADMGSKPWVHIQKTCSASIWPGCSFVTTAMGPKRTSDLLRVPIRNQGVEPVVAAARLHQNQTALDGGSGGCVGCPGHRGRRPLLPGWHRRGGTLPRPGYPTGGPSPTVGFAVGLGKGPWRYRHSRTFVGRAGCGRTGSPVFVRFLNYISSLAVPLGGVNRRAARERPKGKGQRGKAKGETKAQDARRKTREA
jgi:hypothetical protein